MRTAVIIALVTSVLAVSVGAWLVTHRAGPSPSLETTRRASEPSESGGSVEASKKAPSVARPPATAQRLSAYQEKTVAASLEVLAHMERRARLASDWVLLGRVSRQRERLIAAARSLPRDGQLRPDLER